MINSYDALTLGHYEKILQIPKDLPDIDYRVKVLAVITGKTEDDILDQPLADTQAMAREMNFLLEPLPKCNGKSLAASYQLGSFTLVPSKDVRKWTTAQYIDYQTYMGADTVKLPELFSCVLVPKGHTYGNGYDVAEVIAAIREHFTVMQAQEVSAFFLRKFVRSIRHILTCSALALRRTKEGRALAKRIRAVLPSLKGGDGLLM